MASITKRPNGTYQARVYAGRDANGKQIIKCVTHQSPRECARLARKLELEIEEGNLTNVPNMRLSTWIEQWLDINKGRLSPSTYALYNTYAKNHYPELGHLKLSQINEIHLTKFMNNKLKTLSRASVRRLMSPLKKMLYDALKQKSPAREITLPEPEKNPIRLLTETEMQKIHDDVRGTRDEPIILLAAWCGLRRGEIFALKWNDIDWNNSMIRVDESRCVTDDNDYVDKRPKSENGVRDVVVPEYLLGLLENLRKKQLKPKNKKENVVEIEKIKEDAYIFEMRPDSWSSYFPKLVVEKKWPKIRFHDLRHYHASWLYAQNIPDQYAAARLGHDVQILKSIYQHLGLDKRKEIDDNIRQLYKKTK